VPSVKLSCLALLLSFVVALFPALPNAAAADPLVFISAFAGGENGAIHACEFDVATGTLKLKQRTTEVQNPFFLALSPDHKYLYSIHARAFGSPEDEQIAAFAVQGRSGKLNLLNRQSARGSAACYLDVDSTGKSLVVANYSSGSVAALPILPDGSLGEAASFVQHVGSSVDPKRQQGPHAHCIVISPDNRFAFAADLGMDQVLGYRLDAAQAKLSANQQPFVRTPPGAGPRHLTFHPNGRHVYVINEMANSVTMFDYLVEPGMLIERQTLSTLPDDFTDTSHCADLKITPDGRFLYGTNRGHDSIAAYRIGEDGMLTSIGIVPSLGKGPQNLAITADGQWLLCANMPGNNVAVFRIDAKSGGLESVGSPLSMPSPSCIRIVP
jgi:6-phosphogluconolactonase